MTPKVQLLLSVLPLLVGCSRPATVESNPPAVTAAPAQSAAPATLAPASAAPVLAATAAPSGESSLLAVGSDLPDVSAVAQDGKTVRLRGLLGKPLIVYFYPKDDTPGCTIEAKGIRDQYQELKSHALVFGVSTDDQSSHQAFAEKYSLPFTLLVDSSHALATAFGVPLSSGHAKRVTFVIDKNGKVSKVFPNVNPDGHAQELLDAVKALG
jgi:peroxiredoxin Q/BCP